MNRWIAVLIAALVIIALSFGGALAEKAYTPSTNGNFNLGSDKLKYKDLKITDDIIIEGDNEDAYETTLTATEPTADRTVTLPDADLNFTTGIGNAALGITWSDVTITNTIGTSGTATVTAGSAVIGYFPVANVHDGNVNGVASFGVSGTTLTLTINGTAGGNIVIYTVVTLAP